ICNGAASLIRVRSFGRSRAIEVQNMQGLKSGDVEIIIALITNRGRAAGAPAPNPYMASEVNRRTANGGRLFSFRSVITGLRLTQPLLAASGTFGGRCQPQAGPNPYPRVGRPDLQRALATAGSSPRPRNSSVPPRRPLQPAGSRTQSLPVTGFSPENAPFRWKPSIIVHEQASRKC